jgi:hypothetical protein
MIHLVPDGYLPITSAVYQALMHWFREKASTSLERIEKELSAADKNYSTTDPIPSHLVEIIQQKLDLDCQEEIDKTRHRLRKALHKGDLIAVYFSTRYDEPSPIPRRFWPSPEADDVLETGDYFPYGRPKHYWKDRQSEAVLVREEDLRRLLSGEAIEPEVNPSQTATNSETVSAAETYLTPYIALMLQAIEHFAISATQWPKKDELENWLSNQKLPDGTRISPNQAKMMATFARPPEASKGGNKRI